MKSAIEKEPREPATLFLELTATMLVSVSTVVLSTDRNTQESDFFSTVSSIADVFCFVERRFVKSKLK